MPTDGLSDAEREVQHLQGKKFVEQFERNRLARLPLMFIYHANCADGFCAAWVYSRWRTNRAEFIPANYGDAPPDVKGRDVIIADFSYSRETLEQMHVDARSLVVLDHHKTAEAALAGLDYCHFDVDKSGARLVWEHIRGVDREPPWLVRYTEDRDLWKWSQEASKAINAAIRSYPMTFEAWNTLGNMEPLDIAVEGKAILRAQDQIVANHVKNAVEIEMDGFKVLCVNATVFMSEIGHELAKDRPFSLTYFVGSDGVRVWSLRSDKDGVDVSEIAKKHGGGGHKHAAGFKSDL